VNVTVASSEFLREIELLGKVVATKPTIPVLANCLVQAEDTGLRLIATDLEVGLVTFCPATVHVPGMITLPVKHLLEIVRLLPDQDITLTVEGAAVRLSAGNYNSRVQTYPAKDYPHPPSMHGLSTVPLPDTLQDMVRRVRFAVSDKDKRYFMDGAQMTESALAATDGHRLAYTVCTSGVTEPVIIPSKTLDKLSEMLTRETLFALGERHLFFVMDGRMLFSRMVAGQFPKYERIIPRDTNRLLSVSRVALQDALRRMVLTANEITFSIKPGMLTLTGRSTAVGDAAEQVEITYDGPDATLILGGAYLLDFLNAGSTSTTTIAWKEGSTILFTDGDAYAYVQMPMRNA
jgi:DNA polymerase-3 subunit beta